MAVRSFDHNQLNYIVFRYLLESRSYTHSAFNFRHEAGVAKSQIDGDLVPAGTLVRLVQKGLQHLMLEANERNGGAGEDFICLKPWDIVTKGEDELQKILECMAVKSFNHKQLNYIVFRYLLESRSYTQTAFNFRHEAGVEKFQIDGDSVLAGTLVRLVQKGIQHLIFEANERNAGAGEDFIYLKPWDIVTKGEDELQKILEYKAKNPQEARGNELNKENAGPSCHVNNAEETDNKSKDCKRKRRGRKSRGRGKNNNTHT